MIRFVIALEERTPKGGKKLRFFPREGDWATTEIGKAQLFVKYVQAQAHQSTLSSRWRDGASVVSVRVHRAGGKQLVELVRGAA